MKYVIERGGRFYSGFFDGRPIWTETRRPETQFDGDLAEKIVQQLVGMGFVGCELKLYKPRPKKSA